MLNSEMNFGFRGIYKILFPDTSDTVDSAIFKDAVECPGEPTCFKWASIYHNILSVLNDLNIEINRDKENWTDENNRPFYVNWKMVLLEHYTMLFWLGTGATFLNS